MFYFHPYLGKWSNLTNIFQMGWNHQLDNYTLRLLLIHELQEPRSQPELLSIQIVLFVVPEVFCL